MQVVLDSDTRVELQRRMRASTSSQREASRARIILACEVHETAEAVGRAIRVHPSIFRLSKADSGEPLLPRGTLR